MTEEQLNTLLEEWKTTQEVVSNLTKTVKENIETQNLLLKEVRTLQESVDRIDSDLADDRKDYGDVKIAVGKLSAQQTELYERMNRQTQTVTSNVVSAVKKEVSDKMVDPVTKQLDNLNDNISKKTKVYIKEASKTFLEKIMSWRKK